MSNEEQASALRTCTDMVCVSEETEAWTMDKEVVSTHALLFKWMCYRAYGLACGNCGLESIF